MRPCPLSSQGATCRPAGAPRKKLVRLIGIHILTPHRVPFGLVGWLALIECCQLLSASLSDAQLRPASIGRQTKLKPNPQTRPETRRQAARSQRAQVNNGAGRQQTRTGAIATGARLGASSWPRSPLGLLLSF